MTSVSVSEPVDSTRVSQTGTAKMLSLSVVDNTESSVDNDGQDQPKNQTDQRAGGQSEENISQLVWWGDMPEYSEDKERCSRVLSEDFAHTADRGQWDNKAEFVLSCVGLSVGLGNIWRFPHLAYENGGAAFLFAYLILQVFMGKPIYILELAIGQFSGKGPTRVWDMNPSAKGVGYAMCLVSLVTAIYYNVIMAYTLHFFLASLHDEPPWTKCLDEWIREDNCVPKPMGHNYHCTENIVAMEKLGSCICTGNNSIDLSFSFSCIKRIEDATVAAELYFYKTVIRRSAGMDPENMGTPIEALTVELFICWTVVVFCLIKGIKSSGKVVYFTATFPYFILFALLIRTYLLEGSTNGLRYFFLPKWEKLTDMHMWAAAAGQVLFSLNASFGGIIVFGSYNKFRNRVYADALLVATLDILTSMVGGLVVFMTFGVIAHETGADIKHVVDKGYGLAFIVYPEALSTMEPPKLWSLLFFFMLFTLGLDSEFALVETFLTCLQDELPKLRQYKAQICVALGAACFMMALPCVCPGGDYVVTLLDHYGADNSLLFLAFVEMISVTWVYGSTHFLMDLEYMLGKRPFGWRFWMFCWTVLCPLIPGSMVVLRVFSYKPPKYPTGEPFPAFAQAIGWMISALVICPIPLWFIYMVITSYRMPKITNAKERKKFLFSPNRHWMPNDGRSVLQQHDRHDGNRQTLPH